MEASGRGDGSFVARISRINLRRNLPRCVAMGSRCRVELIVSSEFFDAIPGLIEQVDIFYSFSREGGSDGKGAEGSQGEESRLAAVWIRDEVAAYDVMVPKEEGVYRLRLHCELLNKTESMESERGHNIVLPWISDKLVVAEKDSVWGRSDKMLSCYREFDVLSPTSSSSDGSRGTEGKKFLLQEDYGAGIGSHIYDSAVVLMRYLARADEVATDGIDMRNRRDTAIELGSGCGLVGLFLGEYYESVFLTDKSNQMPLLEGNVSCNQQHHGHHCRYHTQTLDWSSRRDRDGLIRACREQGGHEAERDGSRNRSVDLIVAADVLYDRDAAASLTDLLLELVTTVNQGDGENDSNEPRTAPVALVAQKMRGEEAVDVATLVPAELRHSLVHEEYAVKVWLLTLKSTEE